MLEDELRALKPALIREHAKDEFEDFLRLKYLDLWF